ncbi:amino acid deaminase/aldolase [Solirubrobacter sp. CPCC 204708]|uniref:Amino acid deaminase/aldolase n=1 Tax=Solirubrobacter deserti TaxID=2282478 RepID=A0ABT4RLM9_9ACTN|nr:amino acid deaminase/aldolase [Solirubrobacter deserti]MDA0139195.1 amino acid deaminase/aldolase [Solirubrobacter deserti]
MDAPFAVIDLDAFDFNAADLKRRARGVPLRLASKSLRVRALQERALNAGFAGVLAFTLPEALWLASHGWDDLVVGYPTVDRAALRELVRGPARERVTVMVDCAEHLDLIAAAEPAGRVKVCIDVDAGWRPLGGLMTLGAKRSPLHDPVQVGAFAREVVAREYLELDGLMAYEGQIAGVGDKPPGRPLMRLALPIVQGLSARELARRRAEIVDAVRSVAPLRFVNGGGTGSVERTAAEPAVTEVAAGSGLFGPTLFDTYRAFRPAPAAFFVLPVVRKPSPKLATALGGGYVASGAPGRDRLPRPVLPHGLKLDALEAAGEVQTPLLGSAAAGLRVGDQVWFRHAKAGELCERFDVVHLVQGGELVDTVPTYRGEGKTFL